MKTSEILDKAAAHIERYGWIKGKFVDHGYPGSPHECPSCAAAAIGIATNGHYLHEEPPSAEVALAKHLGLDVLLDDLAVTRWNDDHDRTAEQVIAELRACAASEREAGR